MLGMAWHRAVGEIFDLIGKVAAVEGRRVVQTQGPSQKAARDQHDRNEDNDDDFELHSAPPLLWLRKIIFNIPLLYRKKTEMYRKKYQKKRENVLRIQIRQGVKWQNRK
jgi:hypothetical protein